MTWIKIIDLPGLHEKVGITIGKQDDYLTTQTWINLDTGAKVHVVNKGGWRHPEDSSIRVYHESPNGSIVDITSHFGDTSYDTDPAKAGVESYSDVYCRVVAEVEQMLHSDS